MTEDQYNRITEWQDDKFPNATPLSCAKHHKEEAKELAEAIEYVEPLTQIRHELADNFMLLMGVANKMGMKHADIVACIEEKFDIVQKRTKWVVDEKLGYAKHVD